MPTRFGSGGVALIDADEVDVGVGGGGGSRRVGDQEADGHNRVVAFANAGVDIGGVIGLRLVSM